MIKKKSTIALVLISSLFITGCSSKKPLLNKEISKDGIKKLSVTKVKKKKDDISLILTFSGGGTRAASFSYGVLKELKNQGLLEEVDIISSVSGGSFTSAYYGLYGDRIFKDFEEKFLKKPIQSNLVDSFLNPMNWLDMSLENRSEYVSSYYEKEIFGAKTFKDLRKDSPKILINATDISTGNPFTFSPDYFKRICSDWESYPIGKAVTASSAVPLVFSPIVLQNHKNCNFHTKKENFKTLLKYNDELHMQLYKYNDKENYKFLHLIDGGITDNLGLRALLHTVAEHDNNFNKVLEHYGIPNSKKIAVIVVNSADRLDPNIAKNRKSPDISAVMGAVSTIQLQRYNTDTLDLVNFYFDIWKKQLKNDTKFYLIELNFKQLPKELGEKFMSTQTSLELDPKRVDELIEAGSKVLRESKELKRLLQD